MVYCSWQPLMKLLTLHLLPHSAATAITSISYKTATRPCMLLGSSFMPEAIFIANLPLSCTFPISQSENVDRKILPSCLLSQNIHRVLTENECNTLQMHQLQQILSTTQ